MTGASDLAPGWIQSWAPLAPDCVQTSAYGGCYISRADFERREEVAPGAWRLYDAEDSAMPEAGPLWQWADGGIVRQLATFFGVDLA